MSPWFARERGPQVVQAISKKSGLLPCVVSGDLWDSAYNQPCRLAAGMGVNAHNGISKPFLGKCWCAYLKPFLRNRHDDSSLSLLDTTLSLEFGLELESLLAHNIIELWRLDISLVNLYSKGFYVLLLSGPMCRAGAARA